MGHSSEKDPHVVIVGAGFGGLRLARRLSRLPVRVTLLDRNNYHLSIRWQRPAFHRMRLLIRCGRFCAARKTSSFA